MEQEEVQAILEASNLLMDEKVRFKDSYGFHNPKDLSWTYGKVKGASKDGSIALIVDGRWRCILPDRLQVIKLGPRGGKHWVGVEDR